MPTTSLGQINVLIGPNNSGKSSILRALYSMQQGWNGQFQDVRIGHDEAIVEIGLKDAGENDSWGAHLETPGLLTLFIKPDEMRSGVTQAFNIQTKYGKSIVSQIPSQAPKHFIVPFFSNRKAVTYAENVSQAHALSIGSNFQNLAAKLSRLANPSFPSYSDYSRTCMEMLGFVVTAIPSQNGQRPGIYLPDQSNLFIEKLGEGVPHIVGMIAELMSSSGKLFLIEEPENDLHPGALKALLDLILKRSEFNQFVISTHSNIVLRHLGSHKDCKVFSISSIDESMPPEAKIEEIDKSPEARLALLESMGYGLSDFDLWDGWLILEESSAERVIRDYLIPWFAPKLSRLRTISARGVNRVEPIFDDYFRLVCFAHLEGIYRKKTWVRVDCDVEGEKVVEQLREKFPTWEGARFETFTKKQFEQYYPQFFSTKVAEVLALEDRGTKREAKRVLLNEVIRWLDEDPVRAKEALAESAADVVAFLRQIEEQF